ncbi:hypothetical protein CIPAW_03G162300 [Carya illinoinensis]|uniref:Uncharacterized protein n=1 Tax=Carya illinoinensis TaxID=32201 RepID=A0A8T1R1H0_CARIL|nr:hypothetical protein CIPAW_03G162300 [Carya illinoinensis]
MAYTVTVPNTTEDTPMKLCKPRSTIPKSRNKRRILHTSTTMGPKTRSYQCYYLR